jgi:hypothetical protein
MPGVEQIQILRGPLHPGPMELLSAPGGWSSPEGHAGAIEGLARASYSSDHQLDELRTDIGITAGCREGADRGQGSPGLQRGPWMRRRLSGVLARRPSAAF